MIWDNYYPDGSTELYTYNQAWKVQSFTDRISSTSSYGYDAGGNVTTYAYDAIPPHPFYVAEQGVLIHNDNNCMGA